LAEPTFPWRDGRSLGQVLEDGRPWLQRRRIIRKGGGSRASAVAAADKRLGEPLPRDVRDFLLAIQPVPMFKDDLDEDGPSEFFFYGPEPPELRWQSLAEWAPKPDWIGARGLAIGQTGYGDGLYWVTGHRVHRDGCIAVFDHELAMGDLPYFVVARSLSEFIAKVVHSKGLSPGGDDEDDLDDFEDDDQGDDMDLLADLDNDVENMRLFAKEYAELNPATKRYQGR
jgi:hypothetical protein